MRGFEQERKKVRVGTSGSLWIRSIQPQRVSALPARRGAAPPRQMKSNPRPPVVLALAVALSLVMADQRALPVDTAEESLQARPAGSAPASPRDLLAWPRTAALVDETSGPFELELTPVLAVADIECPAHPLDTVLLPCRGSKATDSQVRDSVTRLRQIGAEFVATVLDGVEGRRGDHGHGNGHGTEARSRDSAA